MANEVIIPREQDWSYVPDFDSVPDFCDDREWYQSSGDDNTAQVNTATAVGGEEPALEAREKTSRISRNERKKDEGEGAEKQQEDEEEEVEPEEPLRGLYFVKIPRPDLSDLNDEKLQQEFDVKLSKIKLLNESRRLKIIERKEAKDNFFTAIENRKETSALIDKKMDQLKPFRAVAQKQRSIKNALYESKRGLEAETEEELNQLIKNVEFDLSHNSYTIKEEKDMVTYLKKLRESRPRVKKHEAELKLSRNNTEVIEVPKGDKATLEKELKVLKDERDVQRHLLKELQEVVDDLEKEVKEIEAEIEVAVAAKDRLYNQIKEVRQARKSRLEDFNKNRDFSRKIRQLVDEGQIDYAKQLCEEQVDEQMKKLNEDDKYRKNYLKLWEMQKNPFVNNAKSGDVLKSLKLKNQRSGAAKTGNMFQNVKVQEGQDLKDAIIERCLREADEQSKAMKSSGSKAKSNKPTNKELFARAKVIVIEPEEKTLEQIEEEFNKEENDKDSNKPKFDVIKDITEEEEKSTFVIPEAIAKKEVEPILVNTKTNKKKNSNANRKEKELQKKERALKAKEAAELEITLKLRQKEAKEKSDAEKKKKQAKITTENVKNVKHGLPKSLTKNKKSRPVMKKQKNMISFVQKYTNELALAFFAILMIIFILFYIFR